jgi:hypothetical protein
MIKSKFKELEKLRIDHEEYINIDDDDFDEERT